MALAVVGVASVPNDIAQWREWGATAIELLSPDQWRLAFLTIGVGIIATVNAPDRFRRGWAQRAASIKRLVVRLAKTRPPARRRATPPSAPRPGESLTPEFLTGLYTKRTTAQATILIADYLGKSMTLTGRIMDIDPRSGGGHSLFLELEKSQTAFARFDKSWDARVNARQIGDTVTVTGALQTVEKAFIALEDSQLHA